MKSDYGIVYFIGAKDVGAVKVGYTSSRNAEQRLRQLQTGSADSLVVLGEINGGPLVERAIHNLLGHHRVRGEWFERGAALSVLNHLNGKTMGWADDKFGFALADIGIRLEPEEESTPQQSLASRVAADLISDRIRDILSLPIGQPVPMRAWLQGQQERDDPTGELAKAVLSDKSFPPLGTLEDYLRYITDKMSNPSVTRAVFDAWIECALAIKALPFKNQATIEP